MVVVGGGRLGLVKKGASMMVSRLDFVAVALTASVLLGVMRDAPGGSGGLS